MNTHLHSQTGHFSSKTNRPVFKNPEKPEGGSEREIKVPEIKIVVTTKELAEQRERIDRLLKDYEKRRKDLLAVIGEFKQKEDPEQRLKATQYENRVLNETVDPTVLRALRGLGEEDIKKYMDRLVDIANTTLERDERLASWLDAREKEKTTELVNRYNLMREVNIAMVRGLENFFGDVILYEDILNKLTQGFPELKTDDDVSRKSVQVAILELNRVMDKFRPQVDAARGLKHAHYESAFYHALGRVHDRNMSMLETNPAEFESRVAAMLNNISEVDLKKIEAGESWSVNYEGLTFSIRRGGAGMSARLTDASDENLARYAKLGEFLEGRRSRTKTANRNNRRIETEL
jgi:hypothetical protein